MRGLSFAWSNWLTPSGGTQRHRNWTFGAPSRQAAAPLFVGPLPLRLAPITRITPITRAVRTTRVVRATDRRRRQSRTNGSSRPQSGQWASGVRRLRAK